MSSEAWIRAQRLALWEHAAASLRKNRIEAEEKIFAFRCEVEVEKYTFLYVDTF